MEGLPGWVVSSIRAPPPRQHKREKRYTPSTRPLFLTGRVWKDDYDCQMIFGDIVTLKLPDIFLRPYRWRKTPKKPHPGNLSQPGIEPGPAAWQVCMLLPIPQRDEITELREFNGKKYINLKIINMKESPLWNLRVPGNTLWETLI